MRNAVYGNQPPRAQSPSTVELSYEPNDPQPYDSRDQAQKFAERPQYMPSSTHYNHPSQPYTAETSTRTDRLNQQNARQPNNGSRTQTSSMPEKQSIPHALSGTYTNHVEYR